MFNAQYAIENYVYEVDLNEIQVSRTTSGGEEIVVFSIEHWFEQEGFYIFHFETLVKEGDTYYRVNSDNEIIYD